MRNACEPLHAIAGFAAMLRDHGLQVGVAEQQAFVTAALALPIERARHLQSAWRAIACRDPREWRRWPELFGRYWFPQRVQGSTRTSGRMRPARDLRQVVLELQQSLAGEIPPRAGADQTPLDTLVSDHDMPGDEGRPDAPRAMGGASRTEALHDRALAEWLPQELGHLDRIAERIAARLRQRVTRRWRAHPRGRRLDVRRTLRESLRTGGLPMAPAWRRPRRERVKLFILVDVSRSMETHAQLFLRIARAFVGAARARVFVFHTRLAEVTPLLQRDSGAVQEKVNAVTAGFGGGTRIATSMNDFLRVHARGQLGRSARVWVLSDGFDADPPEALAVELAALRARGAGLTWFHPADKPPASRAIENCRTLIDRFVRLNRLRDLEAAVQWLH